MTIKWRIHPGVVAVAGGCVLLVLACALGGFAVQQRRITPPAIEVHLGLAQVYAFAAPVMDCVPHDEPPRYGTEYHVLVGFGGVDDRTRFFHVVRMPLKPDASDLDIPGCDVYRFR